MGNRIIALAFLLAFPGNLFGQLLWEIRNPENPDQPSYLFGTIHLADQESMMFDTLVYEKVRACQSFAMEILPGSTDLAGFMEAMRMPDSIQYQSYFTQEEIDQLDSIMQARFEMGFKGLRFYYPIFAAFLLEQANSSSGYDYILMDSHLMGHAEDYGLELHSLESMATQANALVSVPLREQFDYLRMSVMGDSTQAPLTGQIDSLQKVYRSQDLALMQSYIDSLDGSGFQLFVVDERNRGMCDKIEELSENAPCFISCGAAHLGGDKGLVEMLKERGFELKPIHFTFYKQD